MKTPKRKRRIFITIILILTTLCLLLVAVSVLSNSLAPSASEVVDHLDDLQKAQIAEMLHLRRIVGSEIWSGFGQAEIPVIVWNESYAFLVGLKNPASGWRTVPRGTLQGSTWETLLDDDFFGESYYRQPLPADGTNPQAFTVQVGEHWVASLQTKAWMLISFSEQIRQDFTSIFPHWAFARLSLGSTERYISPGLLHESFHAFQGLSAPERLEAGERANRQWADSYPWDDETFQENWQAELDILAQALRAESDLEIATLSRDFLSLRSARRTAANLTPAQIEFERRREWVEGLAKYTDIAAWQLAYTSDYQPVAEILADPDFDNYESFPNYWKTELSNLTKRASDEGDGRFYYTGMAQAFLLDRLLPNWKERVFSQEIFLDELLTEAISQK